MRNTRFVALTLAISLLLSGCGDTSESESVSDTNATYEVLSDQADQYTFKDFTVKSFNPFSGYAISGDRLLVHPVFNLNPHIEIEEILLSDTGYWDTVLSSCMPTGSLLYDGEFQIYHTDYGETYGYKQCGDKAILAYTDSLPSGYVKIVMENITYDTVW